MNTTEEIKNRLDIVTIVGEYVALKKAGNNYKGLCPFHKEATPSFTVSQQLQFYKCFGCGEGGDIFTFTEKMEGYDFPQALEVLAQKAGVELPKTTVQNEAPSENKNILFEINNAATKFYSHILLKHAAGEVGRKYLFQTRGIKEETAKTWHLGYAPDSWDALYKFLLAHAYTEKDMLKAGVVVPNKNNTKVYDKFRGRIVFPLISHDGKILGFGARTIANTDPKYLNTQETSIFHKEYFLYGLNNNKLNIRTAGAVLVEGYMDVVSSYQAGINNTVATCGTALTIAQLKLVSRYSKDITICFDSDPAGVQAAIRGTLLADTLNLNPKIAVIPKPHKDIDDFAKKDLVGVQKMLKLASNAYDFIIATVVGKYDKSSALGKKNILEELVHYFSEVRNPVILDHYSKILAEELNLDLATVQEALVKKRDYSTTEASFSDTTKVLPLEDYALALMLANPKLDKTNVLLQNLCPEDFRESINSKIFQLINELADKSNEVTVKQLEKIADTGEIAVKLRELSMLDVLDPTNEVVTREEEEKVAKRIKKESNKRTAHELTKKIKAAEKEDNEADLERLVREFNRIPKDLK